MKLAAWAFAALTVAACSQPQAEKKAAEPAAPMAAAPAVQNTAPPGEYKLDNTHASVTFRVNHLGLSRYTARFTDIAGKLNFDPANPAAMSVEATVDPNSLETDFPLDEPDFDAELTGPQWLDAGRFPTITFKSTKVEPTGANTAKVTGDFTLHGVTRPLTLDVTFNGGYAAGGMDPSGARIGFSAKGEIKRSEFGIAYGVPAAGTNFGVSDAVEIIIEAEFTQPGPAKPAA
ncbi:polyisoprenoid-binding protein YceI [Phenylobacterium haematophilum]|uniref:Polyisoprenoid-binding protein YceI n=1 Tax=Phenylobacterium haematophilum TaxID=98513 RepID=A0A839ZWI1_9CAUL|nr:YceI family protein [Phenylobacterium haematophilum]MBB3890418.1 polyisoprenoid-binding protein YceI [Phenylobacterium haematophilum]